MFNLIYLSFLVVLNNLFPAVLPPNTLGVWKKKGKEVKKVKR